jgi:crotonyl-CoA carboxylase/reductase
MGLAAIFVALQYQLRQIVTGSGRAQWHRPGERNMATVTALKSAGPKDLYEIGEIPPLGHVPSKMYAWTIRKERHGPPESSMQIEVLPTWPVGDDEECNGGDPMLSPSQRIWGYETPDGSFAQFCRVQSRQLMPRPQHLTWEESASYTLTLATAYRMLFGHAPHTIKPGDYVLVWGASGGLGVFGVQLAAASGAHAIGIISDDDKKDYVLGLGAKGVINRKNFNCWGQLPKVNTPEYNDWVKEARKFGKAIWDITGKRDVDIVFEHPGEQTFPVSTLVAKRGGMIVFCAGTTGFNLTFDARYVWMRQKRIQGSHFAHLKQAAAANQFVLDRRIDPCMSEVLPWAQIPQAHMMMWKNQHKPGNMAVLVNAPRTGLRSFEDVIEASGG